MGSERINDFIFKTLPNPVTVEPKTLTSPKVSTKDVSPADKQLFSKQELLGNDLLKLKLLNKFAPDFQPAKSFSPAESSGFQESYPPGAALEFSETKGAAYLASQGEVGDVYQYPDGSYWRVDNLQVQDSGLRAVTLREVVPDGGGGYVDNPEDDRVVVAFAGSNALDDWDDNLGQGIGFTPKQYDQALEYTNNVIAEANKNGEDVSLAGHSLGGGLASYVSIKTGLPASTINAAPLNKNKIPDGENFDDQITQYYVDGETLTDIEKRNPFDARPGRHVVIEGKYDESGIPGWKFRERAEISGKNHSLDSSAPEVTLPEKVN